MSADRNIRVLSAEAGTEHWLDRSSKHPEKVQWNGAEHKVLGDAYLDNPLENIAFAMLHPVGRQMLFGVVYLVVESPEGQAVIDHRLAEPS